MGNEFTQRFIKQMTEDAETLRQAAETWEELEKRGARLEDLDGNTIATAAEMVRWYRNREMELRRLIERRRHD